MSIFSLDNSASVTPVQEVEETVDHYENVNDEDYTKVEEPNFGEDL